MERAPSTIDTRRALRVSMLSIGWTLVSGTVACVLGLRAGSLALVAFGAIGVLDAAGSVALVVHFRHALAHEVASERHERIALNVVTLGLVAVGAATAALSVRRLVAGSRASEDAAGIALAAVSVVALLALAARKRQLAARVGSAALGADGWLSATGALLALVTLAGTVLANASTWAWPDPVAATLVAVGAIVLGVQLRRAER
jgi:divalent metal cation (Fe/Co/Zn/Cd) transporter